MKISTKISIGVVTLAAVGVGTYFLCNTTPSESLDQNQRALAVLESGQCLMCHSSGIEMPFYTKLPIAKGLIQGDIEQGLLHADLSELNSTVATNGKVDEVTLAKLERVVKDRTMPMTRFAVMHWGSAMTEAKAEILEQWIASHRADNYTTGLAAAEFANEPIQPLIDSISVNKAKAELGFKLFHDTRFSLDNTLSCASCHSLQTAGVDNKQYSEGVGGQFGGVNAPTVFNATFNFVQFWDGRAANLAAQAGGPPMNPVEMASASWEQIIDKLKEDKELTAQFTAVYADGYSGDNLTDAIAEFEKTLITPNSRFDRYLKGDKAALTAQEIHGYQVFKDNKCATCHVGANIGGQSYELMGLKDNYFVQRGLELTEEDNGRFKETKIERDRHRFKTPTLRNVALTAPYMHDGTLTSLEQAVDAMMKYQIGTPLSDTDRADMVQFLNTLTGEYNGQMLGV